jgi:hypothetical protein
VAGTSQRNDHDPRIVGDAGDELAGTAHMTVMCLGRSEGEQHERSDQDRADGHGTTSQNESRLGSRGLRCALPVAVALAMVGTVGGGRAHADTSIAQKCAQHGCGL